MNERIQKLFNQALVEVRVSIDPHTLKEYPDPNGPHTKIEFSAEKFAELIVKECAIIANRADNTETEIRCMYDVITEHFGVE